MTAFENGSTCWLDFKMYPRGGSSYDITDKIRSCSLTWDWDSDTQLSGTVDIVGVDPLSLVNGNIDVHYNQKTGGTTYRSWIAETWVDDIDGVYDNGEWSGSAQLVSKIGRLSKVKCGTLRGDRYFNSKDAASYINSHSIATISVDSSAVYDSIYFVPNFDTPLVELMKRLEGSHGDNHLSVSPGKAITLERAASSSNDYTYFFTTTSDIFFSQARRKTNYDRMYNRVIVRKTTSYSGQTNKKDVLYVSTVASSSKYSYENTGQYIDYTEHLDYGDGEATTEADQSTANYIMESLAKSHGDEWEVDSMWHGVMPGNNIGIYYDGNVSVRGLLVGLDLRMSAGGDIDLTSTIREW